MWVGRAHSEQLVASAASLGNAAAAAAAAVVAAGTSNSSSARFQACLSSSGSSELLKAAAGGGGGGGGFSGSGFTTLSAGDLGSSKSGAVLSSLIDVRKHPSTSMYSVSAASKVAAGSSISSSGGPLRGVRQQGTGTAAAANMTALQAQLQKMAMGGDLMHVHDL